MFAAPTEKELDERLEYEMDEQDMEFVSKTLQQQYKLVLNEDKFEQIIDRLEKESFKLVCIYKKSVLLILPSDFSFARTGQNVRNIGFRWGSKTGKCEADQSCVRVLEQKESQAWKSSDTPISAPNFNK